MRHAPKERNVRREIAQEVVNAAQDFEGALGVRVEDKRQGPPKLPDLPSLQKLCSSRFGWPASKTLEVAQELYDGQGKKIITYPRAEVRYLPESLISDVPKIVAGLQAGRSFSAISVLDPPVIRKGASGSFHDKGLEGASHHAVIPNVNTVDNLREIWPRLSIDEKKLSTLSRGLIWPPSCPTSVTVRRPQRLTSEGSLSALPVASPLLSAGAPHFLSGSPLMKKAMKRNCCQHSTTARPRSWKPRPLRTKRRAPRRDTTTAP
jgi:DNA topoisomerase-3